MDSGAQLAAGAGLNSRPIPRDGFPAGGRGGRGAREARYVHTPIGTSSEKTFRGSTAQFIDESRRKYKTRVICEVVKSLNDCGRQDQAMALVSCGKWFRKLRSACGSLKLEVMPCDSIFCPDCANRRSKPLQRDILDKCNKRGKSYWLLTLTVPNVPDLSKRGLKEIVAQFSALRESAVWSEVKEENGKSVGVTGGVYSLECTFNAQRGDWHPHIHALIEMPKVVPLDWIHRVRAAWERISPGAKYLHFDRLYGQSKKGKKVYRRVNRRGLREVVKYVTKCADFSTSPERVDEFLKAFKHVRRVQSFGSFFGVEKQSEREPGDDDLTIPGCQCGRCSRADWKFEYGMVHISETVLNPDGTRQLAFDYRGELWNSKPESPPDLELERESVERYTQEKLEFSGALPEESEEVPSLFAA